MWLDVKKHLVEQLKRELDANGIEIPFQQQVVYVKRGAKKTGRGQRNGSQQRDVYDDDDYDSIGGGNNVGMPPGPSSSAGVNLEEAAGKGG